MKENQQLNNSLKRKLTGDMTKEYLLCSQWGPVSNCREPDYFKNHLINSCGLPESFSKRVISVVAKEKVMSNTWAESFKLGRIGKTTIGVFFYVVFSVEGLSEAQVTAMDAFWVGVLSGRDSKKFF